MKIDSHSEYYSLKRNLLVSVACGIDNNGDFKEEWANKFMDSHASSHFVDFFILVFLFTEIFMFLLMEEELCCHCQKEYLIKKRKL